VAEAAEARDDLVGAEEDVVPVAELAHPAPVAGRRRERTPGVLHRLHDHHRNRARPGRVDRVLELLEEQGGELLLGLLLGPVVAVRVPNVVDPRHERLERVPESRDPVDRQGSHRRAVVGDVARDCLPPPLRLPSSGVVLARELPGRLDRLRAARAEEDAVEVARRDLRHLRRELDRARMRVRPVRVEGQLLHLVVSRPPDLVAERVADVDGEETGERVEVALAVRVLQVAAVPPDDDRNLAFEVPGHAGEVEPEMIASLLLEVRGHAAPFIGWLTPRPRASGCAI
jgi:hypothetical protein